MSVSQISMNHNPIVFTDTHNPHKKLILLVCSKLCLFEGYLYLMAPYYFEPNEYDKEYLSHYQPNVRDDTCHIDLLRWCQHQPLYSCKIFKTTNPAQVSARINWYDEGIVRQGWFLSYTHIECVCMPLALKRKVGLILKGFREQIAKKRLAVAMALHQRLGMTSNLGFLPDELLQRIVFSHERKVIALKTN